MDKGAWQNKGSQRVRHDLATKQQHACFSANKLQVSVQQEREGSSCGTKGITFHRFPRL